MSAEPPVEPLPPVAEFWAMYWKDTGEVFRFGSCPSGNAVHNDVPSGAAQYVSNEVAVRTATHYMDANGLPVLYTPEQAALKAVRPGLSHKWSNQAFDWVDTRALAQLKADRWDQLKATRDAMEFGTFDWDGSAFDADQASQTRIIGAALQASLQPSTFTIAWTTADNSVRTLNAAQMLSVATAMGAHIAAVHAAGRTARADLEAATTAEQANGVDLIV